jgi:hypothetical protein
MSRRLMYLAMAVFIFGLVPWALPDIVALPILIGIPWLVLWLCWQFPQRFILLRTGPAFGEILLVVMSSLALGLRVGPLEPHVKLGPLLGAAVLGAAAMVAAIFLLGPPLRQPLAIRAAAALLIGIPLAFYPGTLIALANQKLDRAEPRIHWVKIKEKREGKSGYSVIIADGTASGISDEQVRVSREVFQSTAMGGVACARVYPGALWIPWYSINAPHECPRAR